MKILIAIHGSHSRPEQMQAQRDTWLKDLEGEADYRFFLGAPALPWFEDIVFGEYPDGPVFEGIARTWFLNRKTEALAKYALDADYDYVFKCDDDTYANTHRLLPALLDEWDYAGFTDTHYTRTLGWYRWAQGGAGYWLSRRAMEIVAQNGLTTIPAEDFAVGNVLAANGIHPHHDELYIPAVSEEQFESLDLPLNFRTAHKVSPEQMRRLNTRFSLKLPTPRLSIQNTLPEGKEEN